MTTLSINDMISISKIIPDIDELGLNLDFNHDEVEAFEKVNKKDLKNMEGTFQMLKSWSEKDGSLERFLEALRESSMRNLANEIQADKLKANNQGLNEASNTQEQPSLLSQPQPLQSTQPAPPRGPPGNDGSIDDETLRKLGKRIFTGVDELASALGVKYAELKRYKAVNYRTGDVTADGTIQMLFDWREKVAPPEHRMKLGQALQKAQLVRIKEEYHL